MRRLFTFWTLFLLTFTVLSAQHSSKLGIKMGLNIGASRLYHDTDFRSTVVNNLYEYVAELFDKEGIDYSWEQFAKANELNSSFIQPRFGFSAHVTYRDWPAFLTIDAMSSSSGYEKMAYSISGGMGKDFPIGDNLGMFLTLQGGYKFVHDKGFGSNTIINGVGDKSLRKELQTFFDVEEPLGSKNGNLFMLKTGVGKLLGETENITVGAEIYGELDLTDHTTRASRMTNVGM